MVKAKKARRGQITLFIIIGIVVLFAFAFVFYIATTVKKPKAPLAPAQIPTDVLPVQNYVSSCLDMVSKEALEKVGRQGGRIELNGREGVHYASDINGDKVAYWIVRKEGINGKIGKPILIMSVDYYSNPEKYPWIGFPEGNNDGYGVISMSGVFGEVKLIPLEKEKNGYSIQDQLEKNISAEVYAKCSDFSKFDTQGLTVNYVTPTTKVTIGSEDVLVKLNYPLEIKRKAVGDVVKMEEFYSNPQVRLKQVYEFARDVAEMDTQGDLNFDILEKEKTVNGYKIEVISTHKAENGKDSVVTIIDKKTDYSFRFAIANRRPALIEPVSIPANFGVYMPYPQVKTIAYDPDEDMLRFTKEDCNALGVCNKLKVDDKDLDDYKTGVSA